MFASWLDTTSDGEWQHIGSGAWLAVTAAIALVSYFSLNGDHWVPLLDNANLVFHEAGHPIFGLLLGERITVYGGTMGQLAFPIVAAISFMRKRETAAFALSLVWLFENLLNIARYMADARAHLLPLVGNGEHDWTEIFSRWGVLDHDIVIAGFVRFCAWMGMAIVWIWLFQRSRRSS